jgi:hypothetical protein
LPGLLRGALWQDSHALAARDLEDGAGGPFNLGRRPVYFRPVIVPPVVQNGAQKYHRVGPLAALASQGHG